MSENKSKKKNNITSNKDEIKDEQPITENKESVEVDIAFKESESIENGNKKQCLKKFYSKGNLYFMFNDQCLKFPMDEKDSKKNLFTVTYVGEFGKGDFEIINVE